MIRLLADLRSGLRALAPGRFPFARFAAALAIGGFGGYLFSLLALPLAWMLGAMTACTIAALAGAPIAAPAAVRPPVLAVIGVLMGSGFRPDLAERLHVWRPTLIGLIGFVLVCALACITYFRKVGRLDPITAFFAGMPGGLAEMVVAGDEKGGDPRIIALVHSARVLLVVFTLPFLVQWLTGTALGSRTRMGVSLIEAPLAGDAWLIAAAFTGAVTGHILRIPAKFLLGPMVVSAVIHTFGWSDFVPPREVVNAAQLVLGVVVGCRFLGTRPAEILRILGLSLGSTVILLAVTIGFAIGISRVSDQGVVPILLAYSPGGLAEMSLVALALQIEVAFVAVHHIARILIVMVSAVPIFSLIDRRRG